MEIRFVDATGGRSRETTQTRGLRFSRVAFLLLVGLGFALGLQDRIDAADTPAPAPSGPQTHGPWSKVVLVADRDLDADGKVDDVLVDPMEIAIAPNGKIFWVERAGVLKSWDPKTTATEVVGKLDVFAALEDGLLGIALDPKFAENSWLYLFYSSPQTLTNAAGAKSGENRVARFQLRENRLDLSSEKVLIRIVTQRDECCHSAGSLTFDGAGNLYIATGDNTHPGASDGYSPVDEMPGRGPWNAAKSAANANDLRGKILRIRPTSDGGYAVPDGNLFPPGTPLTRPEIYVMGNRNPFRISVDRRNGYLYWGEVGPDAGGPREGRGPAGFDEINQARRAGNFGWPYFIGDNRPYWRYDFATKKSGDLMDVEAPVNESQYNTGPKLLPKPQGAFIWYPYGPSTRFPVVNGGGGRTACAGPVYHFDPNLASPRKLPREMDRTLFIYEWSRNWIIAVHLDADDQIRRKSDGSLDMERFCPTFTFRRPMDLELGPDGCLYVLENGTGWTGNRDTQLVRIEYDESRVSGK